MEKIEHIGIAVNSIESAGNIYEKLLNTKVYKTEDVPAENVMTAFLQCGPNKIELLQATSDDSPIAKFIAKKGEGIHHIAFEVTDIRAEMQRLKNEGFILLNDEPKRGADNKLVCFVHPKGVNGVLVELCESVQEINILERYQVRFFKKKLFDEQFNTMESDSSILNQFLTDIRDPNSVDEFVIKYIDNVLNGINTKDQLISESMITVEIDNVTSKFYLDPKYSSTETPVYIIPTKDFKQIAEAWMNYLSEK